MVQINQWSSAVMKIVRYLTFGIAGAEGLASPAFAQNAKDGPPA